MSQIYPQNIDRLIVHQFDPGRPSPGGIDTCLRGICRYAPHSQKIAVIGVNAGGGGPERRLGRWEEHKFGDNTVHFLPVANIDPADQKRIIPHSLRLAMGVVRYAKRIPRAKFVQAHRMDTGFLLSHLMAGRKFAYYIHTQENGLTGKTSDSFWKKAARIHALLERKTARRADEVIVFNKEYSEVVAQWTPSARFSPTWFDPRLIPDLPSAHNKKAVCWVGRLEVPKDPELALSVLSELNALGGEWTLEMVGSGTLLAELQEKLALLPSAVRDRTTLHGRLSPEATAAVMQRSSVFLMTSHPGYEGYPRVLVEALASGLPAVVTHGSDTGGLVTDGVTGYACGRDSRSIATRISSALDLDRDVVRSSVSDLAGPTVIARLFPDSAES